MITKLTISLPEELRRQAHAKAVQRGETVSAVVRAALQAYVDDSLSPEVRRMMEGRELQEDDTLLALIGRFEGGPADLSTNKHAYATE